MTLPRDTAETKQYRLPDGTQVEDQRGNRYMLRDVIADAKLEAAKPKIKAAAPVSDTRHPGSARFHEIVKEIADLHDLKQRDYGSGADPFANVRSSQDWGIPAWVGAMVRLNDKVTRLKSLASKGSLANEAAEDSMRDIAVYAIIALVLLEEDQQNGEAENSAS